MVAYLIECHESLQPDESLSLHEVEEVRHLACLKLSNCSVESRRHLDLGLILKGQVDVRAKFYGVTRSIQILGYNQRAFIT